MKMKANTKRLLAYILISLIVPGMWTTFAYGVGLRGTYRIIGLFVVLFLVCFMYMAILSASGSDED